MARPRGATPKPNVASDGTVSWKVRYRTATGRQTSETFYGEQAEPAAAEFAGLLRTLGPTRAIAYLDEQAAGGDRHGPALTVDDLFTKWFEWKSAKKRDGSYQRVRSKRTLEDYESQYRRKIKPRFGRTPANLVASGDVQRWVDDLGGELEPKTVLDYHGLLRSLYLWGLHPTRALVIHDPCADTDLPKRKKKPPKGLRPEEWWILHEAAETVDLDAADLLLFMVSTSWRWSECVPLIVASVDHWLEESEPGQAPESFTYVTMGRVLRRVGSTFEVVEDAKSEAGMRRVRVKGPGEEMLLRRIRGKKLDDLVFTTKTGRRWVYSNFHDRIWSRPDPNGKSRDMCPRKPRILEVAIKNGFTQVQVTPHWMRHTHVAMMIRAGEPLHAISRRVGHSSTKVTGDVYGRMVEDISPEGLDKVSAMISRPAGRPAVEPGRTPALEDQPSSR
jgi:integrase